MTKTLMLAFALLLSTAWLQAQNQPASDQPSRDQSPQGQTQTAPPDQTAPTADSSQVGSASGQMGNRAAGQTSVEGCLQNSNGNYTLTDDSGNTYQLQGDTAKFSEHVGHEVRITGTTSGATAGSSGSDMSSGNSQAQPTLTVQRLKHISKTCNNDKAMGK